MANTIRMLVVTDAAGKIVAAAHTGKSSAKGMNTGIRALAGQQLHEVEVPGEIAALDSGHSFHAALSQAEWHPAKSTLKFPKGRARKTRS